MRPLAFRTAALVSLLALAAPGRSLAQGRSANELAQHHHERGTVHYNLGRFHEAITEYRKGYEQKAYPVFLFNIGQAYRQLGVHPQALFFYRRYLSTYPEAPNRSQVEEQIAELEKLVQADDQLRSASPVGPLAAPPPNAAAPVDILTVPAPVDSSVRARPPWQRWWFWAAAGGILLGAIGVAALAASSGSDGPPRTDLGSARFF